MACGCKGRIRQVRPAQVVNAVAVRTEDRERAIERYTQDQAAERIYRARVTADRQAHPVAVFLKVISGWTAGMYGQIVVGRGVSATLVEFLLSRLARSWTKGVGFLGAHALGLVGRKAYTARLALCRGCSYRKVDYRGVGRCYAAHNGKGCGCPEYWWWFPGYLAYKLSLRNFRCPIGHFGRQLPRGTEGPQESPELPHDYEK